MATIRVQCTAGNLWSKARDSVAAGAPGGVEVNKGSAVSAILGIQATKEAEAAAAHEAQVRVGAEAEAYAAEARGLQRLQAAAPLLMGKFGQNWVGYTYEHQRNHGFFYG
eukprot:Skav227323  [mRNA]  locus=scaffold4402:136563:138108:+ [translate_table: standard]